MRVAANKGASWAEADGIGFKLGCDALISTLGKKKGATADCGLSLAAMASRFEEAAALNAPTWPTKGFEVRIRHSDGQQHAPTRRPVFSRCLAALSLQIEETPVRQLDLIADLPYRLREALIPTLAYGRKSDTKNRTQRSGAAGTSPPDEPRRPEGENLPDSFKTPTQRLQRRAEHCPATAAVGHTPAVEEARTWEEINTAGRLRGVGRRALTSRPVRQAGSRGSANPRAMPCPPPFPYPRTLMLLGERVNLGQGGGPSPPSAWVARDRRRTPNPSGAPAMT